VSGGPQVGVYVCHCGGNISDVVDVEEVAAELAKHPDVKVAKTYAFMCSDPGQQLIVEDIRSNGVDRVVVAACSPALHEQTFRSALQRAGLNPYLYENVNIREQVSWVHKGNHESATAKAIRLTRAGVEKVARQDPLEAIRVNAERRVCVVGAGVAGMRAALAAAKRGLPVTLIEKSDRVGGRLLELDTLYPTGEKAADLIEELAREIAGEDRIELLLDEDIEGVDGYVGNFTVRVAARGGRAGRREIKAGALIVATGFSHYEPHDGEFSGCLSGTERSDTAEAYAKGRAVWHRSPAGESLLSARFKREPEPATSDRTAPVDAGPVVVTLPQFNALLRSDAGDFLRVGGREVRNVAFIHCVGSRQVSGIHPPQPDGKVNDYCSRVCCTAALHTVNKLLDCCPTLNVYDVYKDIRTYGRGHEELYEQASKRGVLFFRYDDEGLPVVADGKLRVKDWLTWGEEVEIPVDLVVLVTGMMPGDASQLIASMKLPVGADRFLQEVHPKLRPVELANNGVMVAGTAQGPMDILESCAAAEAAAGKAAILLSRGSIELDPFVARVRAEKCDGCEKCLGECEYKDALTLRTRPEGGPRLAVVNAALCVGCGACVAVCPARAIDLAGWSLDQFDAMVDALVAEVVR
jgi:heterodisulfide reductase subunit A